MRIVDRRSPPPPPLCECTAAQMVPEECCSGTSWRAVHGASTENASVLSAGGSLNCQLLLTPRYWPERAMARALGGRGTDHGFLLAPVGRQIYLYWGVKSGQIYARVGDCAATWFGSRELGWPKLITFLVFLSFTVTHIDIAFIISQSLHRQLPKGWKRLLQPYTKNSTLTSEKSKPSRLTIDLKAPHPSNAVTRFPAVP